MANTNIMFKVGDADFSDKVIGKDYQVQNEPQFKAWTDANGSEHRSVYRNQMSGTFTMLFETIELYQEFCQIMAANMNNDTSYHCSIFDIKSNTSIISDYFVTYTPSRLINDMWEDAVELIKITIKER